MLNVTAKHYNPALQSAHNHSSIHRNEILASEQCGCFFCCQTFPPAEIDDWTDKNAGVGTTALCPKCGVDSIIGSRAGFPLTPEFLREMYEYWFT